MGSVVYRWSLVLIAVLAVSCASTKKQDPANDARYHYLMGASALNENNPTDALREFMLAEGFDGDDPEIQAGLAEAFLRKQAYDKSEVHFQRALELSGDEPKYHNNLGALYLNMGRYDDAARHFEDAATNLLFDRPEVAWTGAGFARFLQSDYPAAERAYLKAVNSAPRYFQSYFRLGELYYAQNRPAEAIEQLTHSLQLAPNFADGHYWLGLTYMRIDKSALAKSAFNQVLKLAPESESARLAKKYLDLLQ
ncbi:MAG: hypothetical protein C0614_10005 [Desulfuromonas sp.]|nr:MAG: hypothetical protein C0614_10005 [Desulfuromonas sp.]